MGLLGMSYDEATGWFYLPAAFDFAVMPAEWQWGEADVKANKALDKKHRVRRKSGKNDFYTKYYGGAPGAVGDAPYYSGWRSESDRPPGRWSPRFTPDLEPDGLIRATFILEEFERMRDFVERTAVLASTVNVDSLVLDEPAEWLCRNYPDYATDAASRASIRDAWLDAVFCTATGGITPMLRKALCGVLPRM